MKYVPSTQRLSGQQAKADKGAKEIERLSSQLEAKDRELRIMQNSLDTSKKVRLPQLTHMHPCMCAPWRV